MAALGDDAIEHDATPDDAPAEPRALKVRGWAGRGPVGLAVVSPPAKTKHSDWWWAWWLLTGGELNGRPRTNATLWRFGTKSYARGDRLASRWSAWPRAARAAVRLVACLLAVALVLAYLHSPTLTLWLVGIVVWQGLAVAGWAGTHSALTWRHRKRWVWPLHRALAPVLGYPERTPPRRYIYLTDHPHFAQAGGQVEVALPPDFVSDGTDDLGKAVATVLRRKLCLNQVSMAWRDDGDNHFLIVSTKFAKPVPRLVRAENPVVMQLIEEQPSAAPLLGLGAGGVPVGFNFDTESPHGLASVGSGGGKSELTKGILAHFMHHGAEATILDFKYTSHDWARGIANIARSIESIHLRLVALGAEADRRNQAAEAAAAAGEHPPNFRRHVLLIEEANATITFLQLWWQTHRRTLEEEYPDDWHRYGDPRWARSPAAVAMLQLMSMGRQRRMHVLMVAQHATSNAVGGPEIREQFGARMVGRASDKAWKMLAPDIAHPPVCSWKRGRMYLVREGRVYEFQAVLWGDQEARAWATSGESGVLTVPRVPTPVSQGVPGGHVLTPPADTRPLVTLAEAHEAGLFSTSLAAVKRASTRDLDFPEPVVRAPRKGEPHRYDPTELRIWDLDRHKNKVAS